MYIVWYAALKGNRISKYSIKIIIISCNLFLNVFFPSKILHHARIKYEISIFFLKLLNSLAIIIKINRKKNDNWSTLIRTDISFQFVQSLILHRNSVKSQSDMTSYSLVKLKCLTALLIYCKILCFPSFHNV